MKCVRPAYSFSSVAEGARLCSLRMLRFRDGGLMWSCSAATRSSGARAGLRKSTAAGERGLRFAYAASKNARFVPGMYCSR
jgi:hypothetical protein